jgi:hypothetical protein
MNGMPWGRRQQLSNSASEGDVNRFRSGRGNLVSAEFPGDFGQKPVSVRRRQEQST